MNTKAENKYSDLIELFKDKTHWHKARIKCTVALICAMCKLQTVSFVKLSQGFEGNACVESNHRRIQRYFAEFAIDRLLLARLIFALLPDKPPYKLSLDRTNWKFGKLNINILMLSVCYKGIAIPLLWKMLPKRGNSNAAERKELLDDYLSLFGIESISAFLADREFIGENWFENLIKLKVPFYRRIKGNMKVHVHGKGIRKASGLFNHLKIGQCYHMNELVELGQNKVYLSGLKVLNPSNGKAEFVIIASLSKQEQALINYKDRWQIETMFKAMKSSGFNLEETHLTHMGRLSTLISIVAIAFIWAYLAGIDKHNKIRAIKIKKHGRKQYSFFKYGLLRIAYAILNPFNNTDFNNCIKVLSCT